MKGNQEKPFNARKKKGGQYSYKREKKKHRFWGEDLLLPEGKKNLKGSKTRSNRSTVRNEIQHTRSLGERRGKRVLRGGKSTPLRKGKLRSRED